MRSKKLLRQLKKTLGSEDFERDLQDLVEQLKSGQSLSNTEMWVERFSQFGGFLDVIDNAFSQNETMLELANRSLEVSTKELFEANEKFRLINRAITSMVNSLDEGFLVIDREGVCGQIVSLAAKNFLGREPVGERLANILNVTEGDRESFNEWLNMVFNEVIPFDDLIELAPKLLNSVKDDRRIEIKYKPIRNPDDNKIIEIVVILIDVSERAEAERKLGEQKLFTDMVIKYLNNKPNFVRLIQMTRETADSMKSWVFNPNDWKEQINSLTRELHTLKGGLNTLSMYSVGYKIHQTEDEILTFGKLNTNLQESEDLIRLLGQELQETLDEFLDKHRRIFAIDDKTSVMKEVPTNNVYKFCSELLKMGLTDLLKYYVDEIVAVPFASLFAPIEANIYSQSINQDKSVEFKVVDPKKIKVIPEFYTTLFEQMVHIFNNVLDHGIETVEERQALQKSPQGKIQIVVDVLENFQDKSQSLRVSISDDGHGIDPQVVREKLEEKGIDASSETDEQVIYHIFDQGFSTRKTATMTSGRGVGMSAVLKVIQSMGGTITVHSVVRQGTTFEITVPFIRELNSSMVELLNSGNDSNTQRAAG
jgi:two-component system chemotaxis sensor kinase CheA